MHNMSPQQLAHTVRIGDCFFRPFLDCPGEDPGAARNPFPKPRIDSLKLSFVLLSC